MFKYLLLALLPLCAYALEISLDSAMQDANPYATLKIKDRDIFLCEANDESGEIVCAFSKKPSSEFRDLKSSFFELSFKSQNSNFFLIIKPHYKAKLIPMIFDLVSEDRTFDAKTNLSKEWVVVGYKEDLPLIKSQEKSQDSLAFPFEIDDELPFVDGLDFYGKPVFIESVADASELLELQDDFAKGRYEIALLRSDSLLRSYPSSLFLSEFLYYKIKALDKIENYEELVGSATRFIKEYSSDENLAEVLSLIGKAYTKMTQTTDAKYFFDRLFDEYPTSIYASWAYVYLARDSEANGYYAKAIEYYTKVLKQSSDVGVALEGAFGLAKNYANNSLGDEASSYVAKIYDAQRSFFAQNLSASLELMRDLARSEQYEASSQIATSLVEHLSPSDGSYEEVLRDSAMWQSKLKSKAKALEYINRYLELFDDGVYADELKSLKDELFFDIAEDMNESAKLAKYDELIDKYAGDLIASRAVYEKAKFLFANGHFDEVLALKDELRALDSGRFDGVEDLLSGSAVGSMESALAAKECKSVLSIALSYNIEISKEWGDGIFECALRANDYELARRVVEQNLDTKDLAIKKKWLFRYVKNEFARGNYDDALRASEDLVGLASEASEYDEIYRYRFDIFQRLEDRSSMVMAMQDIIAHFGTSYEDLPRYASLVSVGDAKNESALVIEYASKVQEIEKQSNPRLYSPQNEFMLYDAYMDLRRYEQAYETIKSLDGVELSGELRSRQKYLLGNALLKLWRDGEALRAYDEAMEADENSAWAKLAKKAKEVY